MIFGNSKLLSDYFLLFYNKNKKAKDFLSCLDMTPLCAILVSLFLLPRENNQLILKFGKGMMTLILITLLSPKCGGGGD